MKRVQCTYLGPIYYSLVHAGWRLIKFDPITRACTMEA